MRFVEFTQPIQEEIDYSDKAEALKTWETKYNKYKNELGQELPRGYIRAMTDTGIESDAWEASEWEKALKVVGKEDYDWEDEDYLKAIQMSPITKSMKDELGEILGVDVIGEDELNAVEKVLGQNESVESAYDYHIKNSIPFRENIFRPGSDKYFELFNHARKQFQEGKYQADWEDEELLNTNIGEVVTLVNGYSVPLDQPFDGDLAEAEYRGKNVQLNSPKRGGSKKYYVYVKNPKTGNVKKVSWGDTTGLSTKAKNPGAVKSFVARHQCHKKNDKTKAGYWACRTPRYKSLGVKGGAWW
jgi:hypothetical protein